ncbi:MAG TPA: efflux RND transporter periplasmic adaptor subunit [Polyangia bacterium]|nr:efflux RND transporter periplasmic adaptor subunit [Polyangia bacterium]
MLTLIGCAPSGDGIEAAPATHGRRAEAIVRGSVPRVDKGFIGVIVAHESVDIVPKATGRLKELTVRLGDKVTRDAVVARLDAQAARQELRMAEASLRAAEAELDKATVEASQASERAHRRSPEAADGKHLFSQEEVSDANYQAKLAERRVMTASAAVAEKSAHVKQLRSQLEDLELRAPFDGTVSLRYVDPGGVVGPTTPILRLINPDDLWVRFAIPENRAAGVAPGERLRVAIETMTDVNAVVEKVAPEVDVAARMIIAEAKLDVPPSLKTRIRPGLAARAFADGAAAERAPH